MNYIIESNLDFYAELQKQLNEPSLENTKILNVAKNIENNNNNIENNNNNNENNNNENNNNNIENIEIKFITYTLSVYSILKWNINYIIVWKHRTS